MTSARNRRRPVALIGALGLLAASCGGPSGGTVGLIGDSITELSQAPLHQELDPTYNVELVGKFGARSDQVLPEVEMIAASKPVQAIINIGTNDALQQVSAAQTRASIDAMVAALAGARCVFLVEINEAITDQGATRSAEARAINDELRSIASSAPNVRILEWNKDIEANGGPSVITDDTVHLSTKGLVVLADRYRQALDSC